ncbi:MAG: MGMT family protein [Myxococcales bacterium]|nr:MGMT family protein [Myxococcales bacterium]
MTRSAIDTRDGCDPPRVEQHLVARPGAPAGKMLISSPIEIDALVRRIPEGKVLVLGALRASLARAHRADFAEPTTTEAFLHVVAEAAEEERAAGRGPLAPYWRVVHDDGALIEALPGGFPAQARRLAADDVTVLFLGKIPRVTEISHFAWTPPPLTKKSIGAGASARVAAPPRRPPRR